MKRTFLVLLGCLFLFGGPTAMAWAGFWSSPRPPDPLAAAIVCSTLAILCVPMGGLFILAAIKYRIILYADAIETVGIVFNRRLRRDEIGAKALSPGIVPSTVLLPWRKDIRRMVIEDSFDTDDVYRQWLDSIPDADHDFFRNRRRGLLTGPKTS